jgi:hypothetical protein
MSIRIAETDKLRQVLETSLNLPIHLVDEHGRTTHVVISAEAYSRLRALLEDEPFDVRDTYAAQSQALAKVWDDPELDLYNDYDRHRSS